MECKLLFFGPLRLRLFLQNCGFMFLATFASSVTMSSALDVELVLLSLHCFSLSVSDCFEWQSQNSETIVTLKQTFCRYFDTLDCIYRRTNHLLRTSFSAISVVKSPYKIFSTTITISFPFLPNPPVIISHSPVNYVQIDSSFSDPQMTSQSVRMMWDSLLSVLATV